MRQSLSDQIARNKRSSWFYSTLLVLLLAALGAAIGNVYLKEGAIPGAAMASLLGVGMALFSYYFGANTVLSISGARPPSGREGAILTNVTEEMAIASGLPMPQLYVIDDSAPNAFATGRDPQHGIVVVTTGLMDKLDRDELQGVVAHELAHIRNYDIRLMMMLSIIAGLIPMLADFLMRSMWYGGGRRRSDDDNGNAGNIMVLVGLVLAIIAPIFAMLLQMAVSRKREYMADATAAEMTRYPEGLARALEKISRDPEPLEVANRATAHLYISNPLKGGAEAIGNLFSTHPPIKDRISRLRGGFGNPIPEE